MPTACAVCQSPASKFCSRCKQVYYCSKDHQQSHWKQHKTSCSSHSSSNGSSSSSYHRSKASANPFGSANAFSFLNAPFSTTGPGTRNPIADMKQGSRWSQGLDPAKASEWFVDCFRMRMDDDYAIMAGDHFGLYYALADGNTDHVLFEFLIFCKLAVLHGVTPPDFSWETVVKIHALDLLGYAFEKSDAQEKYGSENVFAVVTGGRSLRFTAEEVYGFGVQETNRSKAYQTMSKRVRGNQSVGEFAPLLKSKPDLFDDVGGVSVWNHLCTNFNPPQIMRA